MSRSSDCLAIGGVLHFVAMPSRRLICLANSRKGNDGRCFAGYDATLRHWVRPIGRGWNGAVLDDQQRLEDGSLAELLDVVEIGLNEHAPEPGQPENWSLATDAWHRIGRLSNRKALELLESLTETGPVLGNRGKALTPQTMASLQGSLAVIAPSSIDWRKTEDEKVYALITHANRDLELKVSDPAWEAKFADATPGIHRLDPSRVFLVLSVTAEARQGWHTKLVAGVVSLDV